jgi:HK97 family phage prohead protease
MNIEHKVRSFDLKATDDGAGFEGLGAVFHNIDGVGDIIAPGAFADELPQFLQSGFIGGLNHNWDVPIGHPIDVKETPEGLYIKAIFDDSDDARNVRAKMVPSPVSGRATIRQLSIGYHEKDAQFLKSHDEVKAYWLGKGYEPTPDDLRALESRKTVRLLKKVSLYEVSPVTRAANSRAAIFSAKGGPESRPSFTDHSRQVVSAVEEFARRAASRIEVRQKDGREISAANRRDLQTVHDSLSGCTGTIRTMLDRTAPKIDLVATEATVELLGGKGAEPAEVQAESATAPDAAKAQTPADADLIATYHQLKARLRGEPVRS